MEKTNVMRVLDQKKISYTPYDYSELGTTVGTEVAAALGQPEERVFKTLVTFCNSRGGGAGSQKSGEGRRREIHRDDKAEGTAAAYRLHSRRMLTYRNEKVFYHHDP